MIFKVVIVATLCFTGYMGIHTAKRSINRHKLTQNFIVNGTPAAVEDHPHMVALTLGPDPRTYLCGGSLVSRRTVLTAAHCMEDAYVGGSLDETLRVTVGTNIWHSGGHTYSVERNITHPHFLSSTFQNDLGLVITTTDVQLSSLVQHIALSYDDIPGDVETKVAGWGNLGTNQSSPSHLIEVKLKTISGERCVQDMKLSSEAFHTPTRSVEPHIEICTYTAVGLGTCVGDSGSALTRSSDGHQIGVVSWGLPCARGAPDVYARISGYANWLKENIV